MSEVKKAYTFVVDKNQGPPTFWQRYMGFVSVVNPMNFFKSHGSIMEAKDFVD